MEGNQTKLMSRAGLNANSIITTLFGVIATVLLSFTISKLDHVITSQAEMTQEIKDIRLVEKGLQDQIDYIRRHP